jgi:muramidase (phage lysozyme)
MRRYRKRNLSSSAGGKFQILDRTWFYYGGGYYPRLASRRRGAGA